MAIYKVAQDVEAEDKLLGPFSFRQFIYLMVAVLSAAAAWGLFQLMPPLVILPLPIVFFFGVLALPLRKDQPTETWLAAIISFYIKPRKRLWVPDGVETTITITAPKNDEVQLTKNLSTGEAEKRLAYLAALADSRGWSIRHATEGESNTAMFTDVYNEAQATPDVLSDDGGVALSFESMIDKADSRRRQEMIDRMHTPAPQVPITMTPQATATAATTPQSAVPQDTLAADTLTYNPYPSSIHQSVIAPISDQPQPAPPRQQPVPPQPAVSPVQPQTQSPPGEPVTTSATPPSPAILDLANNKDLSIAAIQHEADRRTKKHDDDEVIISLR